MSLVNAYPEKPIVPYHRSSVEMSLVIGYLKQLGIPVEIKKAAYVWFRIESQNGQKGINNNYCGMQADSGRWQPIYDDKIIGVVSLKENQTGNLRLFCAFNDYTASLDFIAGRLQARGLYVGGTTHKILTMKINTPTDLARAYEKEWVKGSAKAEPSQEKIDNFLSMYNQAAKLFS
jgi:hypothetical protein